LGKILRKIALQITPSWLLCTPAAPAAGTASVVTFANTPQTLNPNDLID
jgi:hypothetical protein